MRETGPSGPDANPETRRACPGRPEEGLPNCGTGFGGRFRFVVGELADLRRELRTAAPEPNQRDR